MYELPGGQTFNTRLSYKMYTPKNLKGIHGHH